MPLRVLTLLIILIGSVIVSAQGGATSWSDTTRDVYIDGEPDHKAQVLAGDGVRRIAILSPRLDLAIILNQDDQTVHTTLKEFFRFSADHTSATMDVGAPLRQVGGFAAIDATTILLTVDGRPILIRPHTGYRGEMSEQKLWETVPVWRYSMESYQPAPSAVSTIKAVDKETKVTVVLGTWCPDSKNYVPKLMKAIGAAANDKIKVQVFGVDNQFHDPIETIQKLKVVNVPTVIVERSGREMGRIVETPALATVEEDLAAILNEKPLKHEGRWDRGPKLARGEYVYKDHAGKELGKEMWELYKTDDGGYLAHSIIIVAGATTEVWHRVNGAIRPTFIEVTRQRGGSLSRTRYRLSEHLMTARLRSSDAGIIDQNLNVPDRIVFQSPSVASAGFEFMKARNEKQNEIMSYQSPFQFERTVGRLSMVSFEEKGEESVRVPAGQFRAKRAVRRAGEEVSTWWLHDMGFPVRGQMR
ncbi:MAG TPA: thioredoxin family protein, partial [Blastocatellia bacterium]